MISSFILLHLLSEDCRGSVVAFAKNGIYSGLLCKTDKVNYTSMIYILDYRGMSRILLTQWSSLRVQDRVSIKPFLGLTTFENLDLDLLSNYFIHLFWSIYYSGVYSVLYTIH